VKTEKEINVWLKRDSKTGCIWGSEILKAIIKIKGSKRKTTESRWI
jgi:hypothetical protein